MKKTVTNSIGYLWLQRFHDIFSASLPLLVSLHSRNIAFEKSSKQLPMDFMAFLFCFSMFLTKFCILMYTKNGCLISDLGTESHTRWRGCLARWLLNDDDSSRGDLPSCSASDFVKVLLELNSSNGGNDELREAFHSLLRRCTDVRLRAIVARAVELEVWKCLDSEKQRMSRKQLIKFILNLPFDRVDNERIWIWLVSTKISVDFLVQFASRFGYIGWRGLLTKSFLGESTLEFNLSAIIESVNVESPRVARSMIREWISVSSEHVHLNIWGSSVWIQEINKWVILPDYDRVMREWETLISPNYHNTFVHYPVALQHWLKSHENRRVDPRFSTYILVQFANQVQEPSAVEISIALLVIYILDRVEFDSSVTSLIERGLDIRSGSYFPLPRIIAAAVSEKFFSLRMKPLRRLLKTASLEATGGPVESCDENCFPDSARSKPILEDFWADCSERYSNLSCGVHRIDWNHNWEPAILGALLAVSVGLADSRREVNEQMCRQGEMCVVHPVNLSFKSVSSASEGETEKKQLVQLELEDERAGLLLIERAEKNATEPLYNATSLFHCIERLDGEIRQGEINDIAAPLELSGAKDYPGLRLKMDPQTGSWLEDVTLMIDMPRILKNILNVKFSSPVRSVRDSAVREIGLLGFKAFESICNSVTSEKAKLTEDCFGHLLLAIWHGATIDKVL